MGKLIQEDWVLCLCAFPGRSALAIAEPRSILDNTDEQDRLTAWLNARHAARDEVYFQPNRMTDDFVKRVQAGRAVKGMKSDVQDMLFSWVDIDIAKYIAGLLGVGGAGGKEAHAKAEQARIRALIENEDKLRELGIPNLPTVDIASGGGAQGLWKLPAPFCLSGSPALIELVESHMKGIARALGGDECTQNVDRLLRLPGTVNWANKSTKVARGQITALARLSAFRPEITVPIMKFPRVRADNVVSISATSTGGASTVEKTEWCRASAEELPGGIEALIENLEKWGVSPRTAERIVHGGNELDPKAYDSRSENVFGIVRELLRHGVPDKNIMWLITCEDFAISEHCRDPEKNKGHRGMVPYAQRQITRAKTANAKDAANEAAMSAALGGSEDAGASEQPADTGGSGDGKGAGGDDDGIKQPPQIFNATEFSAMARAYRDKKQPTLLVGPSGEFLAWDEACYRPIDKALMDHDVHMYLETVSVRVSTGRNRTTVPLRILLNTKIVNEVRNALVRIQTVSKDKLDLPCWLTPKKGDHPAHEMISFPNTLLHVPTGEMIPQTSRFFTRNALEFDYAPDAPAPKRFMQFLTETWGAELDFIKLAQEWAGYLLTPDTTHHKILLLSGVQRGGKGTFARVVESLVGKQNTVWPEAGDFGERFGGEALIGKSLAIVPEFELDRTTPVKKIVARLKSYSGGDSFSIQQKNTKNWEGRPSTRIIILSNSILNLPDPSGALAGRFLPLPIENSVFGKEDVDLETKLRAELPGILIWAIAGWKRLRESKGFTLGEASKAEQDKIANSSSPLRVFMEETMKIDYAASAKESFTPRSELYPVYQRWAKANGYGVMGMQAFCNALESAAGRKIKLSRPSGRERGFVGVTITDHCQPKADIDEAYSENLSRMAPSRSADYELMIDEAARRAPLLNGHSYGLDASPS
jgi:P4 family phage/plasmid primase-like protien